MQRPFRYNLDKASRKHVCPQCSHRRFVRYIDAETGHYLPSEYGRCDRESACQYHRNPYSDGYAKAKQSEEQGGSLKWIPVCRQMIRPMPQPRPLVHFDFETFKETLDARGYAGNNFLNYLAKGAKYPFTPMQLEEVVEMYFLGTVPNGQYAGAITFPFVDESGNIRAVQVKQFDKNNHTIATTFLHSITAKEYKVRGEALPSWITEYEAQEKKITCLFGAHLLKQYPLNPIALVEAPKTAIYGSLYFGPPQDLTSMIWLAVYNKSSLTLDKLKPLEGRRIIVFPDLSSDGSTFREWQEKARRFEEQLPRTRFVFSDLLERMATQDQRAKGADLADILVLHDWRIYQTLESVGSVGSDSTEQNPKSDFEPCAKELPAVRSITFKNVEPAPTVDLPLRKFQTWEAEIQELEQALAGIVFPSMPVKLNGYTSVIEPVKFVRAHLATIKANDGNPAYLPYLERLQKLKCLII